MSLNVQLPVGELHNTNTFDFAKYYQPAVKNGMIEDQKISSPKKSTHKIKGNRKNTSDANDSNVDEINTNSQATSTQHASGSKIKSIMKIKRELDNNDGASEEIPPVAKGKSKKRNKSVSFLLDAGDETVIKKTKSQNSSLENASHIKEWSTKSEKKMEKMRKKNLIKKETKKEDLVISSSKVDKKNKKNTEDTKITDLSPKQPKKMRSKIFRKSKVSTDSSKNDAQTELQQPELTKPVENMNVDNNDIENETADKSKRNHPKCKNKQVQKTDTEISDEIANALTTIVTKKKKKHSNKRVIGGVVEIDGEPVVKSRKTDQSDVAIAEKIESLSIGDTPHSLSNLIDEMTVSDKNARKKIRKQFKSEQRSRSLNSCEVDPSLGDGEVSMSEKVKWTKRKWNKGVKEDLSTNTTVIVEKLPITMILNYKQLLTDHFGKYGPIKRIGVAELYPAETLHPAFSTRMQFFDEEATLKALEDDNTRFNGGIIRVLRPLPATMTTLVVRSYGELTDQSLSSVFASAGKIRSIKHLIKGRHTIGSSFVEFDGPEALEKAILIGEHAKIGGKKLHVSRFEERSPKNIDETTGTEELE